jgi:alpha-galactosidase
MDRTPQVWAFVSSPGKRIRLFWVLIGAVLLGMAFTTPARAAEGGLASTPPMGWNSWNHFGCSGLNETVIEQTATAMASSGMKAAGYLYVNLDDCWMAGSRDANNNLVPDPTNFPSGMPALVNYVHNLGLKIGLYEDVGIETCQGRPGSYGYYQQDANTFASWGIDYIKMDWCGTPAGLNLDPKTQYTQFGQALTNADKNIVFSICDWGTNAPWIWGPPVGNLWRTTPDISDNWNSMVANLEANSALAASAGPGAWNDPDMLEVGNGGMSATEDQTNFSMWAMMAAPLIAGNDLTSMSSATVATLTNSEVIAVDQDALGKQGLLLSDNGSGMEVWSKQDSDGTIVALMNQSNAPANLTVNWSDIGLEPAQSVAVRDLWAHADLGTFSNSFSANVASHAVTVLKISGSGTEPGQTIYEGDANGNTLSGQAVVSPCDCLDGNAVGYIGNNALNFITMNNVNVASGGSYLMTIYSAVSGTRAFSVSVNGGAATQVPVTGTSFSMPVATSLVVQLNAGANSIQFSNPSAWAPNLDHIVISSLGAVTPGFNISYPTQDLYIASPGQSGAASIALVPTGGFTGNVVITCALPATMTGATCSSPGASLGGVNSTVASLTITTTAATEAALRYPSAPGSSALHAAQTQMAGHSAGDKGRGASLFYALFIPVPGLVFLGFGLGSKKARVRKLLSLLFVAIVSAGFSGLASCGGSSPASSSIGSSCSAVPSAPGGLSAGSTTSSATTLKWSAAGVNSTCAVTGYTVYQNNNPIATTTTTSYAVTGLSPSTAYTFAVAASDSYGKSGPSSAVGVTTGAVGASTPPGTYPVTVTATSAGVTQTTAFNVIVQ